MSVAGCAATEGENIMKKSTSSFFTGQRSCLYRIEIFSHLDYIFA